MECLRCICCCFFDEEPPPRPPTSRRSKAKRGAMETRLNTKFGPEDFVRVEDEVRKSGKIKAYACPICTFYYTRILACDNCLNCVCYTCFESYDKKNVEKKSKMKCPFCNSVKSKFIDYELDPHSYFDTTTKGFISKQERVVLDQQIKQQQETLQRLDQIEEAEERRQERTERRGTEQAEGEEARSIRIDEAAVSEVEARTDPAQDRIGGATV